MRPHTQRAKGTPRPTSPTTMVWVYAGIIILAGVIAYANSFSGQFIFDDTQAIVDNPYIRRLWPLSEAVKAPAQSSVSGRPIVSLTLAVNYAISGLNAWSYHAVNLVIHILCGLLLFGIIRRTVDFKSQKAEKSKSQNEGPIRATAIAGICAIIWIVHPIQTESVTYVIQRAESLVALFYLLTLYCFVRAVDIPNEKEGQKGGNRFWLARAALGMKEPVAQVKPGAAGGDPVDRQQKGKELAKQGKHKEALDEYLWCFDHGRENNLAYAEARLTTLLADITVLGEQYPLAVKALEKRRDEARLRLFAGNPAQGEIMQRVSAASELAALNDALRNPQQTLDAYDMIKKEGPASELIYKSMFPRLADLLLSKKRYADFIESDKAVLDSIDLAIADCNRTIANAIMQPVDRRSELERTLKARVIEQGGKYYEAALGLNKTKLAFRIARKLTQFSKSPKTYESLIVHARRAGNPDAVQSVLKMAEEGLSAEDYKSLSQTNGAAAQP